MDAASAPRYRGDIKGDVANFIKEFEASVRGELQSTEPQLSPTFLFGHTDAHAYEEFRDYLTEREMAAAFARVQRPGYA